MDQPVVKIGSGTLRGRRTKHGAAFLGIPYAAPAVRRDRFARARPVEPWDGIRDATQHGPAALQAPYPPPFDTLLPNVTTSGDDYLNVAVWTPDEGANGLPVLVWIHGGAFVRGANSVATYDGSAFARDGVVVVGVNYRLGVAGFPLLRDARTNLGLRDQVIALRWVRDNIAAFGGDPANVTVMGESAGGMSVATLLAMPVADGLFHRAIVQSGGGIAAGTPQDLRSVSEAIARRLGVAPSAAGLGDVDPAQLLEAQNQVTLAMISDPRPERWGPTTISGGFGIMPTFPAIDGDILDDLPERLIAEGAGADIPLLIGTTAQEFNLWTVGLGLGSSLTEHDLPAALSRYGVPSAVTASYLSRRSAETPQQVFSDVITDVLFREPSIRIAQSRSDAPTYMYEFAWGTDVRGLGACHAIELPFVFDTLEVTRDFAPGPNAPQSLADEVHAAWVRFVKTGDPGWTAYDTSGRTTRRFAAEGPDEVSDPRADDRVAWAN